MPRRFRQIDVFTDVPYTGNPVAVVLDGDGLDDDAMRRFANWTHLSETTFVLPPTTAEADYRVRIFTTATELPFAGHPTLGTCHAWLEAGGTPRRSDVTVQECAAGLVPIRRTPAGLAFAAPPLRRSGPVDHALVAEITGAFGLEPAVVLAAEWVDNGPGWLALLLPSADDVLATRAGFVDQCIGLVGPHPPGSPHAVEVRAFVPDAAAMTEDPVTGSLNASLAQWLTATGRVAAPYTASQGTVLGRAGRVHVEKIDDIVWVGGDAATTIKGVVGLGA